MQLENLVITGGLGFIGSHFIKEILRKKDYNLHKLINVDYMGYGSNAKNLLDVEDDKRYKHVNSDISSPGALKSIAYENRIDLLVNFAAETHVDRSIENPTQFIKSNINGTANLLELARLRDIETFVQVSTDEVYGEAADEEHFTEDSPLQPNNPYSATKAAADMLVRAYSKTYGLKTIITRSCNNFGPNQFPEKLIPKSIIRVINNLPIIIYGDGSQKREWIYVYDHIDALLQIISRGSADETYNISASYESKNIDIAKNIIAILSEYGISGRIEFVKDRQSHDRRYSINSSKLRNNLDWKPSYDFDTALRNAIEWYLNHQNWWQDLDTKQALGIMDPPNKG